MPQSSEMQALAERLEEAVNETTGEFSADLRAAARIVRALQRLAEMEKGTGKWRCYCEPSNGPVLTSNWRTGFATPLEAIEAQP